MNILFVAPYVPSLVRVRPYNLIRELSNRGHEVTVLTPRMGNSEQRELEGLEAIAHRVVAVRMSPARSLWNCSQSLRGQMPAQAVYSWNPHMARILEELAIGQNGKARFDIVHIEHLRASRYGLYLKSRQLIGNGQSPIVWDSVDCISRLFEQAAKLSLDRGSRLITRLELSRTKQYEGSLLGQFDHILVSSDSDKEFIRQLARSEHRTAPISVIPNGVDLEYFMPNEIMPRDPTALVLSGKMSYHANVSMTVRFVKEIFPRILAGRPDATLWIVGQDPPRAIRRLAREPAITVTGTVDDVRPYLQRAALAVAPLTYGVGIQNKVLEAMACRTPVVASPQAVAALKVRSGVEVVIAADENDTAQAVLSLLNDPDRRSAIGHAGRQYVERRHRWSDAVEEVEEIYCELVRARS